MNVSTAWRLKRVGSLPFALTLACSLSASCRSPRRAHGTAGVSGTSGTGGVPIASGDGLAPPSSPAPPPIPGASVTLPSGQVGPLSFAGLVRASDPSVVTVFSRVRERALGGRVRVAEGLGTGFVYDPAGFILTNNHVVAQATDIRVRLADERRVDAKLVGRDPLTDVAVVKVDVPGLQPLPLGNSSALDVGDWVVAIGNPFGLSHTVSAGILSAKGRTSQDLQDLDRGNRHYFNFLQTDAAINQGNSGGPLLNLRGEVVGINTAIRANANNIGFAIPIDMVKAVLPMLVRDGKVTRSALGVAVSVPSEEDITRLHRPDKKGALVTGVKAGGAAARAGIAPDDVIMAFNGTPVADPNELRWLASIAGVGTVAIVRVARGERVFDVKATLEQLRDVKSDNEPEDEPDSAP